MAGQVTMLVAQGHDCYRHAARYRLTCDQYDGLVKRSGGQCEACGSSALLVIDHDHTRGDNHVRGLVCSRCNWRLGQVDAGELDPASFADYLAIPVTVGHANGHPHRSGARQHRKAGRQIYDADGLTLRCKCGWSTTSRDMPAVWGALTGHIAANDY